MHGALQLIGENTTFFYLYFRRYQKNLTSNFSQSEIFFYRQHCKRHISQANSNIFETSMIRFLKSYMSEECFLS